MKHFIDGDQVVVTKDDFTDLQVSPAVFIPCESETGQTIQVGGIGNIAVGDLCAIRDLLNDGGGEFGPDKRAITKDLYLMVVRHDPECNVWVIDDDSRHHLEAGDCDVFELQIVNIRPLVKDIGVVATDE